MINSLVKPIITEKSMVDASRGVYTFNVALMANKNQIREAVEGLFAVKVVKVKTSVTHTAVAKTGRRRITNARPSKKIARVTLKKGQTIALFDLKEEN